MNEGINLDGIAHITGGGLYDNVPRILPEGTAVRFDVSDMPVPPIFKLLVEKGGVDKMEAYRVFNMGVGMVWFVPGADADASLKIARECGFEAHIVGEVVKGDRDVTVL